MLRLLGFFGLTFVVFILLTKIPIIGDLVGGFWILGFFLAAMIVSRGLMKWGEAARNRSRVQSMIREFGAVDSAYNQGKLGSLFLKQGRYRRAVPMLAAACEGEPESAEWQYKHGRALLGTRSPADAIPALERAVELEEEHAYGAAMMRLAEARLATGDPQGSLDALDRVERNHGESPESTYRRGLALRAMGEKEQAKRTFARVGDLARNAVGYQKRSAAGWSARAALARFF